MVVNKRWRPPKLRDYVKLTKAEKEEIYYNYTNGGSELSLSEFAKQERLAPVDMSKLLRLYEVSTWEDVKNELKSILWQDSAIIKKWQAFINDYLDDLYKQRKKVGIKEIETIIKALDNSLKRSATVTKMQEDKEKDWPSDVTVKITL